MSLGITGIDHERKKKLTTESQRALRKQRREAPVEFLSVLRVSVVKLSFPVNSGTAAPESKCNEAKRLD